MIVNFRKRKSACIELSLTVFSMCHTIFVCRLPTPPIETKRFYKDLFTCFTFYYFAAIRPTTCDHGKLRELCVKICAFSSSERK